MRRDPPEHELARCADRRRRALLSALPGLTLARLGSGLAGAALGACAGPVVRPEADAPSQVRAPAASGTLLPPAHAAAPSGGVVPFSAPGGDGGLPAGWSPYVVRRDRAHTRYAVQRREGRAVLHATARNARSGLHCAVDVDPRLTPWLRWQWRVDALHEQATVEDDDAEDTPARLVLAFEGDLSRLPLRERLFYEQVELFTGIRLPYATLTYVWDGRLPVGSVLPYARSRRIQYLVVESGGARTGQWLDYERNVFDDFVRVFGEAPPGRIVGVGVMTDSDDLKNEVEAWYGDIGLHPMPQGVARAPHPVISAGLFPS